MVFATTENAFSFHTIEYELLKEISFIVVLPFQSL